MESQLSRVWRGARPMIGGMIGVGMLGLPFAVAKIGFFFGMIELIGAGLLSYIIFRLYGDLVMIRAGHSRFIHVIGREIGPAGTFVTTVAYFGVLYGGLLGFLIFGGEFLRTLLFSIIPMTPMESSAVFFVLASFLTIGGGLFVARVQRILIPLFIVCLGLLSLVALPSIHASNLLTFPGGDFAIPFGVMLFAFHGLCCVPEMRDALGRSANLLPKSTMLSVAIVAVVYIVFIAAVVGVTGIHTTENAIPGLGNALGGGVVLFASFIALLTTLNAYLSVSNALTNTYLYDLRLRFIPSWCLTALVPVVLYMIGAKHITTVLSVDGGILGSFVGIMVLIAYERARRSADLPKNSLLVPQWIIAIAFVVFVVTMVGTFLSIF